MHLLIDKDLGMEEILRSLGAVLDECRARSVYIREAGDGLLVRAIVSETLGDRIVGDERPMERHFDPTSLYEHHLAALARRGTGHLAGPIERSLRLVGQQAEERHLTGLTLIQHHQDDGWMVWHDGSGTTGPLMFTMTANELCTLETVIQAREGREPVAVGSL